jgi:hypothetical protein
MVLPSMKNLTFRAVLSVQKSNSIYTKPQPNQKMSPLDSLRTETKAISKKNSQKLYLTSLF